MVRRRASAPAASCSSVGRSPSPPMTRPAATAASTTATTGRSRRDHVSGASRAARGDERGADRQRGEDRTPEEPVACRDACRQARRRPAARPKRLRRARPVTSATAAARSCACDGAHADEHEQPEHAQASAPRE